MITILGGIRKEYQIYFMMLDGALMSAATLEISESSRSSDRIG
jgi:hypothetical protein